MIYNFTTASFAKKGLFLREIFDWDLEIVSVTRRCPLRTVCSLRQNLNECEGAYVLPSCNSNAVFTTKPQRM